MTPRAKLATLAVAAAALYASAAAAHTVGWSVDTETDATVLRFGYSDGEPMAFAEVTVTAPDGRVWQKARADREGRFAVAMPSDAAEGAAWQVAALDAEGHSVNAEVTAASTGNVTAARDFTVRALGWVAIAAVLSSIALGAALLEGRASRRRIRA